jgi:hypothetical protein
VLVEISGGLRQYYARDAIHLFVADEIHEAQEVGVLFKSNVQAHSRCMTRLLALHPYSEPAILAWECPASCRKPLGGSPSWWDKKWVRRSNTMRCSTH